MLKILRELIQILSKYVLSTVLDPTGNPQLHPYPTKSETLQYLGPITAPPPQNYNIFLSSGAGPQPAVKK